MQKIFNNKLVIFSLVFPGILIFIFAVLFPILLSGYFGMTKYDGISEPVFLGLKNFIKLVTTDKIFWRSLLNTILLAFGFILIQHPLSIMFAVFIDKISGRLEKFYRAIFFIPCVISIVVTSKMWVSILNPKFGLLNKVLDIIGLGMLKSQWLGEPHLALGSILVICMWQGLGWAMLIYYAGLKGIPNELYEAASIDGATGVKSYFYVTLPMLKPVIRVNITLAVIAALKQMETVYLTTNGGPGNKTQFLANYLYIKAFSSYEYGYANAISILFVIICLIATFLTDKFVKAEEF